MADIHKRRYDELHHRHTHLPAAWPEVEWKPEIASRSERQYFAIGQLPRMEHSDPDVRLRLPDNRTVRIFGYPNEKDIPPEMERPFAHMGNGGSPLLYLRGDIPAYVSYIMGEDWRSRLRDDHHTSDARMFYGGEVILRPVITTSPSEESQEDLEASERAHCLRMLRCGAVAVRSEVDIIFEETGGEHRTKHLFGWPASGGLWILRSYPVDHLRHQSDMDELCRLLKEAGGQFYSNIEDCPEVKKLRLLT